MDDDHKCPHFISADTIFPLFRRKSFVRLLLTKLRHDRSYPEATKLCPGNFVGVFDFVIFERLFFFVLVTNSNFTSERFWFPVNFLASYLKRFVEIAGYVNGAVEDDDEMDLSLHHHHHPFFQSLSIYLEVFFKLVQFSLTCWQYKNTPQACSNFILLHKSWTSRSTSQLLNLIEITSPCLTPKTVYLHNKSLWESSSLFETPLFTCYNWDYAVAI